MNNAPKEFLSLYMPEFAANAIDSITSTTTGAKVMEKILNILPGSAGKKYASFLHVGKRAGQMDVFEDLLDQYEDSSMKITALTLYIAINIDGGSTIDALNEIATEGDHEDLRDYLLGKGAYLSDTVLKTYFNKIAVPEEYLIAVFKLNKPVTQDVWDFVTSIIPSGQTLDSLIAHQSSAPVSHRKALEDELGNAKADLQFIYSEKLNYFLGDTTEFAHDTVIQLLADNYGELPDAPTQLINAYSKGKYYARAFAYADSLSFDPKYEELVILQKVLLQLDTSVYGLNKIINDSELNQVIQDYALDSTKAGSWLARSVLKQVYGKSMNLIYLDPVDDPEERSSSHTENVENIIDSQSLQAEIKLENKHFHLFPNPTSGKFNLLYERKGAERASYIINDVIGRSVISGELIANLPTELSFDHLSNGIYFVSLIQGGKVVERQKLVLLKN